MYFDVAKMNNYLFSKYATCKKLYYALITHLHGKNKTKYEYNISIYLELKKIISIFEIYFIR